MGDFVRLSFKRRTFQRDYQQKWTDELFIVKSRRLRANIPIYNVTDYTGEDIRGTFYEREIQKVNKNKEDLWRVGDVIRKRRRNGREQWFISFSGWPAKFNSWVDKSDISSI